MRNKTGEIIVGLIIGLAFFAGFFYLADKRDKRQQECEARGGTFIFDQEICVEAKRIPLKN